MWTAADGVDEMGLKKASSFLLLFFLNTGPGSRASASRASAASGTWRGTSRGWSHVPTPW